eukprot:gene16150-4899_t
MSNKRKREESDPAPVKAAKVSHDELLFHCSIIENGRTKCMELLLGFGAKVDQPNNNGATPLYIASYNGHTKYMELLLDRGAKVYQPNNNGATPLYIASQNGHTKCMELLLDRG